VTRREILRAGAITALGLTVTDWLRLRGLAGQTQGRARKATAKRCILLWLDGGPSHLDTFDLKPSAPQEVRGPFRPIETNVAGVHVCEHLPRTARLLDKVALVRSVTSTLGEHNFGSHYLLTGYKPTNVLEYPSYGAVAAGLDGTGHLLPPYVAVPDYNPYAGAGFLPAASRPFAVGGDPAAPDFRVRDFDPYPGVDGGRLSRRKEFLEAFDRFRTAAEAHGEQNADPDFEQAWRLIASSEAKKAFDLAPEPATIRERYGPRTLGQSCLLARRLIQAGVPFVTVTDRGWDTHEALVNRLKEGYTGGVVGKIPTLDLAYSALLADLDERGLLDETLVILMGEFGRTPKINTAGGRDHWPRVFSVLLAGGGVRGGQVVGSSDSRGESPRDRPVLPEDLARTIYTLLGIDPDHQLQTPDGRPVAVNRGTQVIQELLA
jgi:hypothetical protein